MSEGSLDEPLVEFKRRQSVSLVLLRSDWQAQLPAALTCNKCLCDVSSCSSLSASVLIYGVLSRYSEQDLSVRFPDDAAEDPHGRNCAGVAVFPALGCIADGVVIS